MTTAIAPLPGFRASYSSLAAFYAGDSRRWPSPEVDLGLRWQGWEDVCGAERSFEWFVARAGGRR
jgi:hypothetical protein